MWKNTEAFVIRDRCCEVDLPFMWLRCVFISSSENNRCLSHSLDMSYSILPSYCRGSTNNLIEVTTNRINITQCAWSLLNFCGYWSPVRHLKQIKWFNIRIRDLFGAICLLIVFHFFSFPNPQVMMIVNVFVRMLQVMTALLRAPLLYVLLSLLRQTVENCVCILHNLTFQLEAEAPTLFSRITALAKTVKRNNSQDDTGPIGCFNSQSKSPQQEVRRAQANTWRWCVRGDFACLWSTVSSKKVTVQHMFNRRSAGLTLVLALPQTSDGVDSQTVCGSVFKALCDMVSLEFSITLNGNDIRLFA